MRAFPVHLTRGRLAGRYRHLRLRWVRSWLFWSFIKLTALIIQSAAILYLDLNSPISNVGLWYRA